MKDFFAFSLPWAQSSIKTHHPLLPRSLPHLSYADWRQEERRNLTGQVFVMLQDVLLPCDPDAGVMVQKQLCRTEAHSQHTGATWPFCSSLQSIRKPSLLFLISLLCGAAASTTFRPHIGVNLRFGAQHVVLPPAWPMLLNGLILLFLSFMLMFPQRWVMLLTPAHHSCKKSWKETHEMCSSEDLG